MQSRTLRHGCRSWCPEEEREEEAEWAWRIGTGLRQITGGLPVPAIVEYLPSPLGHLGLEEVTLKLNDLLTAPSSAKTTTYKMLHAGAIPLRGHVRTPASGRRRGWARSRASGCCCGERTLPQWWWWPAAVAAAAGAGAAFLAPPLTQLVRIRSRYYSLSSSRRAPPPPAVATDRSASSWPLAAAAA